MQYTDECFVYLNNNIKKNENTDKEDILNFRGFGSNSLKYLCQIKFANTSKYVARYLKY